MTWQDTSGMKVLLVDDTPANLDVLNKTLSQENYEIALASNGQQALKTAAYFQPDLIMLDIMMPDMDGYETSEKLKANEKTKNIPIIFITAKSSLDDIIKGFGMGCVDYIVKPFQQTEVLARVRTHLQLEAAKQSLIQLNQQKKRLLGIAAHDIRGPLSGILANLELLHDPDLRLPREQQNECIQTAYTTANQLLTLVNDLLDASVIETGELRLQMAQENLKEIIVQRLRLYTLQAEVKQIRIIEELSDVPQIRVDKNRIIQVIDNLLNNAIKFTPTGKTIIVKLGIMNDFIVTTVIDQGPGLSKKEQDYIFSDVSKLDHQPTAGEKSTCLGLAIAKKIITMHQGSLSLKSTPGTGSQFSFTLPLHQ